MPSRWTSVRRPARAFPPRAARPLHTSNPFDILDDICNPSTDDDDNFDCQSDTASDDAVALGVHSVALAEEEPKDDDYLLDQAMAIAKQEWHNKLEEGQAKSMANGTDSDEPEDTNGDNSSDELTNLEHRLRMSCHNSAAAQRHGSTAKPDATHAAGTSKDGVLHAAGDVTAPCPNSAVKFNTDIKDRIKIALPVLGRELDASGGWEEWTTEMLEAVAQRSCLSAPPLPD